MTSRRCSKKSWPRIAIIGRPNAGKSSLINAFIGEDRHIVTDIAGTTRDSIYTKYNKFGLNFYLVDTAGIRKKGKVNEDLEYYSVIRSIRAIENSDVCVLMLDATRGIESQDLNIFSLVQKNKKGLVVCVNKWDLVEDKSQKVIDTFMSAIRERLAPFTDFPILFISALTKQRILKVLETAKDVYENRQRRVPTAKLNEIMLPIIENYPPPAWKGKYIKIKYITQLPAGQVPSFVFFCNLPQWIKEPYKTLPGKQDPGKTGTLRERRLMYLFGKSKKKSAGWRFMAECEPCRIRTGDLCPVKAALLNQLS